MNREATIHIEMIPTGPPVAKPVDDPSASVLDPSSRPKGRLTVAKEDGVAKVDTHVVESDTKVVEAIERTVKFCAAEEK